MKDRFWIFLVISSVLLSVFFDSCKKNNDENLPSTATILDVDSNVYHSVIIGTQVWLAENLRTTHYSNGDPIAHITDYGEWASVATGAYCDYANRPDLYSETYGRLYNLRAVEGSQNLCPVGWHVATDSDWSIMIEYLGGDSIAGGKLKESGTAHWANPNTGATNEAGFNALPGGLNSAGYVALGYDGNWWTSTRLSPTSAYGYRMENFSKAATQIEFGPYFGLSVRCVKN